MRRAFIRPSSVYEERVKHSRTVYLDTNIWSDLSEAKTGTAQEALRLATELVISRRVIFPLSYALVTEFLKRERNIDSERQADLMDLLSDGVTFRGWKHILDLEALSVFEYMVSRPSSDRCKQLFTLIPCYVADGGIMFPEGWTQKGADDFMETLRQRAVPGLRFLQQHMQTSHYVATHQSTDDKYVREISRKRREASDWARDASGKLNAAKLREEEHTFVFKTYIMQNLPRLVGLEGMLLVSQNLTTIAPKPGRSPLRRLVERMPSTWLSCEINVQATLAVGSETEKQHYYDHEHAALAVAYADAFVTSDGELVDTLRRIRTSDRYSCTIVRGISGLLTYLDDLS